MPEVLILSGPPGCGKSTVAGALADRYDRVAHVPLETLHAFITPTGRRRTWSPDPAFQRQARLDDRNACCLARNFLEARFAVIIEGVILGREALDTYLEMLRPAGFPVHHVRLLPSLEACLRRNLQRAQDRVPPAAVEKVYAYFAAAPREGVCVVDSSHLSAFETADRLQALTTSGESLIWRPPASD